MTTFLVNDAILLGRNSTSSSDANSYNEAAAIVTGRRKCLEFVCRHILKPFHSSCDVAFDTNEADLNRKKSENKVILKYEEKMA